MFVILTLPELGPSILGHIKFSEQLQLLTRKWYGVPLQCHHPPRMVSARPTSFYSAWVNDWKIGASTLWQVESRNLCRHGSSASLRPRDLHKATEPECSLDLGLPVHVIPASHPVFLCFLALLHLCDCVSLAKSPPSFGPQWGHQHSLTDLKV